MPLSESCANSKPKPLSELIRLACLLEAMAAKPGNVHPGASFPDLTFLDFVKSAEAAAPVLARAAELGVGRAIFEAVKATREVVVTNTNLGIVLLIAPLAAVPRDVALPEGIGRVLRALTREDAVWTYRAIRLANPGGLGAAASEDVADEPTGTLLDVMQLAAHRDGVAAQYANDFAWVLDEGVPFLNTIAAGFADQWEAAVIELQLRLLAAHPDSLIERKCGAATAAEASRRASAILASDRVAMPPDPRQLAEFDTWLRTDGNRRNPGTTADLIAACLFAALRDHQIAVRSAMFRGDATSAPTA